LFNNKDILVDGKPIFLSEWFKKGILSINDLLNESGNFLTFREFWDKYSCESNFLQYYQVVSATLIISSQMLRHHQQIILYPKC